MKPASILVLPCFLILVTGCGIEPALSGKAFDDYQKSIKPYIAYWHKEGMTEESRLHDWVACGGHPDGGFRLDRNKRQSGESTDTFQTRLEFEFQRCMIRTGYHYTGNCSREYMKARPLCGAP